MSAEIRSDLTMAAKRSAASLDSIISGVCAITCGAALAFWPLYVVGALLIVSGAMLADVVRYAGHAIGDSVARTASEGVVSLGTYMWGQAKHRPWLLRYQLSAPAAAAVLALGLWKGTAALPQTPRPPVVHPTPSPVRVPLSATAPSPAPTTTNVAVPPRQSAASTLMISMFDPPPECEARFRDLDTGTVATFVATRSNLNERGGGQFVFVVPSGRYALTATCYPEMGTHEVTLQPGITSGLAKARTYLLQEP